MHQISCIYKIPPRPSTLQVQCGNHRTKRPHIAEDCNLFPNQALNKMSGVGWLLRRPGHGLEAAHVGFVVVRRNVAVCWHSYCIFGRCVMKIWAKQPSRLLWGSLMFLCPTIGYCGLGHDHFPTSTCINWKKNSPFREFSFGLVTLLFFFIFIHFYSSC